MPINKITHSSIKLQYKNYIDKCLQVKSKYPLPIRSNT